MIAHLGRPNHGFGFSLAFDETATLFMAQVDRLAIIDPLRVDADGSLMTTEVGPFGLFVAQLAFNPQDRMLYGVELGTSGPLGPLLQIDPETGVATRLGVAGSDPIHALAFDRTGALFASMQGTPGSDRLVQLDPATGTIMREIGPLGYTPAAGLAFDRQGGLFATTVESTGHSQVLSIDLATGQATALVRVHGFLHSLAIMPCPAPCFGAAQHFPVRRSPLAVAMGDLNGDGTLDLAVTTAPRFFGGNLDIVSGDGTGQFTPATTFTLDGLSSEFSEDVAIADLNHDGRADVVAVNPGSCFPGPCSVAVLLANSAGGLTPPVNVPGNLRRVAIGDLNGDGHPDIVGSSHILFGDGLGGFGPPVPLVAGAAIFAGPVAIADLNHDGKPDLVFLGITLIGDGLGHFSPPREFVLSSMGGATDLAVGDLNGDGNMDVAVTASTQDDGIIFVLLGDGAGNFGAPVAYVVTRGPYSGANALALGDVTGDGIADLVIVNRDAQSVAVLYGTRSGTLRTAARSPFAVGDGPMSVAIGDVDGDGLLDVVTANSLSNDVSVLLNEPSF